MGILDPYASTCTASRIVTDARPVRTPANSCWTCSSAVRIRLVASRYRPFRSLASIGVSPGPLRCHERSDRLSRDGALDVACRSQVEHDDGQAVVHAERDGGGVHHLEALLEDLEVRDAVETLRIGMHHGVGI